MTQFTHNHHIGAMLRQLRKHRKLTQSDVADKAGLSRQTIALIEDGKSTTTIDTLYKIAVALDAVIDLRVTPKI